MTTFNISNTIVDPENKDGIIVFYSFSNGNVWSNRFPMSTTFAEIMAWGNSKCEFIESIVLERQRIVESINEQAEHGDDSL
jgi:hypothetical protein